MYVIIILVGSCGEKGYFVRNKGRKMVKPRDAQEDSPWVDGMSALV